MALVTQGQSLIGKWQLQKKSTCLDGQLKADSATQALLNEMKSQAKPAMAEVLEFKENGSGSETTSILSSRKTYNPKAFLYRYAGGTVYILDKKSHTLVEELIIDRLEGNELILSNSQRPCETSIWIRIN